jgi:predicted cupin superfamily sugar epimerase
MDADEIITQLGLQPHPEGGHFSETWRHESGTAERGAGTSIYYLLRHGESDPWHRLDAAEVWHYYAGDPLRLAIAPPSGDELEAAQVLGPDIGAGQRPQIVVPASHWQSARTLGEWTLVGCTVSPAFSWEGFELAKPGWEPGADPSRGDDR